MKKNVISILLALALILTGPINALIVIAAQASSAPVVTIDELSNNGSELVAAVNIESGSFSALNLKFEMSGLECTLIEQGSALTQAKTAEENPVNVSDSTNINITAEGKSNISFACTPEYEASGEFYKITFNITSLKDYSFNINCLKCYQYNDGKYLKVSPSITSNVSYDKTTLDKSMFLGYSTSNGEVTITRCSTSIFHKFEIPSEINGCPVKYIASSAFINCSYLTEVIIPSGVVSIGDKAFYSCTGLESITIPQSVTSIGQNAFYNTAYYKNSKNWDNNVLYINHCLISAKSSVPNNYNIKDGTILLADYAFYNCTSLQAISIPSSVTHMGNYCFSNCRSLKYICSQDDDIFEIPETTEPETEPSTEPTTEPSTEPTEPSTEPSSELSEEPTEPSTESTEPSSEPAIEPSAVFSAKILTLDEAEIKESKLPDSVLSIGESAFIGCSSLKAITIGSGITRISSNTFSCCSSLTNIVIPDNIKIIESGAFEMCSNLTSINIGKGLNSFGDSVFRCCDSLTSIIVSSDNEYYCSDNFGVMFSKDKTELIQYPTGNARAEYTVPGSVTTIAFGAFGYCENLTRITMQEGVQIIGSCAFSDCSNLIDINIPGSVTKIGWGVFSNCFSLKNLTYNAVSASFGDTGSDSPFYNLTSLENVTIGNSVTTLPDYFLYCCTGLTQITIPENVTDIGNYAFSGCSSLTDVYYNAVSVTNNNSNIPFYNLTSVKNVTIGENVTTLPSYFMYGCTGLTSITIPDSVTTIGSYAFRNCSKLLYAVIGSGLTTVGSYAFYSTGLNHVFCRGDETQRSSMSIGSSNSPFTNAVWHYNVSPDTELFSKAETVPATCKSQGYTAYCCAICSAEFNGNYTPIDPDGHKFVDGVCEYCSFKQPLNITLNTFTPVEINNSGEIIRFRFIPETSGTYYFYSDSSYDTYGYIYNSSLSTLASNNNNGNGSNFCVSYSMTAGTVYYLGARFYSSSATGSFSVCVSSEYSSAAAHDFEQTVYESNCISGGRTIYKCKNCNYQTSVTTGEATGHNYVDGICTECGWIEHLEYSYSYECGFEITGYTGSKTELVIPANLYSYKVNYIGNGAFKNCSSLASIIIPDSVTSIGYDAFNGCSSLASITIPDSVTSIGDDAFNGCSSLTSITIPDSVTSIGSYAFYDCESLTNVSIGNSVTNIDYMAFYGCSSLASITIPDSVTSIGSFAFFYCESLTNVSIGNSVTSISYDAFNGCRSLTSITIPDSVTSIGSYAFHYCENLTNVSIGNSVTSIGSYAFYGCSSLTSIAIPDSVTSIGSNAFSSCGSLTSFSVAQSNEYYSSDDFGVLYNKDKTELIQYPIGNTRESFVIPDTVTSIGSYAFSHCNGLTSITIPVSVISIGSSAFYDCENLTNVSIGNSVTSIGSGAFGHCNGLTSITIPVSVISIGSSAFYYCENLTNVSISNSVTSIGSDAFGHCNGLTSITIPDSVISIGSSAFCGCSSLTNINIPNSVTSIGNHAFLNCYELRTVFFSGTDEEWNQIEKVSYLGLDSAYIHFGVSAEDAPTHLRTEITQEATCHNDGEMTVTCDCGYSYTEYIPSLDHQKDELVERIEPTCTEWGYSVYRCSRCGEKFEDDSVHPLGHNFENDKCTRCDTEIETINLGDCKNVTISSREEKYYRFIPSESGTYHFFSHGYSDCSARILNENFKIIAEPPPGSEGPECWENISYNFIAGKTYYLYILNYWDWSKTLFFELSDTYENNGHDVSFIKTVAPTCTDYGYDLYTNCTVCGKEYKCNYVNPLGHDFENGICTRCDYTIPEITLGDTKTATLKKSETAYYKFIPETSGTYYFYSFGDRNTYGDLYDSDMNLLESDDYSGYFGNFKLSYDFEAGQTYYLATRFYYTDSSGSITVSLADNFSDFTIVPGSTTVIDDENKLIYGLASGIWWNELETEFLAVSDYYYTDYNSDKPGTGSVLSLYESETDELADEYTIVIFGDVNGDGWYDGTDSIIVSCLANGLLTREQVGEAAYMAADCNHDGVIDSLDVDILNQAGVLLADVDQTKSSDELLETSSAYTEYINLIDQNPSQEEPTYEPTETQMTVAEKIFMFIKSFFEIFMSYIPKFF